MQSYTLEQLVRLELLAFRSDWEKAFVYYGFSEDDANFYSRSITDNGVIAHARDYWKGPTELQEFDCIVCYLVNKFSL